MIWRAIIVRNIYTVLHEYGGERSTDASFGRIDIPPLENDEYDQFMHDVNTVVNKGALIVSIFTDASGTIFTKDNNGNDINLRLVKSTSYTYSHMDNNGIFIDGVFYFTFDDGSTFSNVDINNSEYWYYIQGVSDMNNLLQWT
jgi:hypothetical protein